MPEHYVVESYSNELTDASARADVARIAVEAHLLRDEGQCVALLGCLVIPDDEVCFWRFAGSSMRAVETVSRRAGLDVQRITRSLDIAHENGGVA